ncbi:DUF1043 family protein [Gammaproteobacteria bacterium LSUCC0057]|uniref:Z-ring associated protein G n=1 Tax=Gammaproteobacteria bacterium LSUCC0057 TaxID=2559237 RepID=A0A4Y8UIP2_9GAMM|nr:DUF1043 family protein [Gammaproteobacteria bacterium LSUCC0057]
MRGRSRYQKGGDFTHSAAARQVPQRKRRRRRQAATIALTLLVSVVASARSSTKLPPQGAHVFTISHLVFAAIALLVGGAIGHFSSRGRRAASATARELRARLNDSEQRFQEYQHEVASHFVQLSQLNANMAQSYREMHEHLAASAVRLAGPEVAQKLLNSGDGAIVLHDSHGNPLLSIDDIEPPRDYAPKVPGGVLSEEYGLDRDSSDEDDDSSDPTEAALRGRD